MQRLLSGVLRFSNGIRQLPCVSLRHLLERERSVRMSELRGRHILGFGGTLNLQHLRSGHNERTRCDFMLYLRRWFYLYSRRLNLHGLRARDDLKWIPHCVC